MPQWAPVGQDIAQPAADLGQSPPESWSLPLLLSGSTTKPRFRVMGPVHHHFPRPPQPCFPSNTSPLSTIQIFPLHTGKVKMQVNLLFAF